jgi:signal transduction histidine kinase
MALNASFRGWPIAAYLGALMALALTAAFVAVVAVVLWLPPRPPDVMRADIVAEHFTAGYEQMRATGRPLRDDAMRWRVSATPPRAVDIASMRETRADLAEQLELTPDQVRIAAARVARSDVFVFRVRSVNGELQHEELRGVEGGQEIISDTRDLTVIAEGDAPRVIELRRPAPGAAPAPLRVEEIVVAPVAPVPPVPPAPTFAPAPAGVALLSGFAIGAELPDGRWLVMRQGRNWEEIGWIGRAMLIIGGTLTVLMLLAALFSRRLTSPIRNFSDAVQAVGVDPQNAPVHEEGPRELRGAARAVNTMQARLRALIADRTKTLAAVAHDMRTPLLRLRLIAENTPYEQRQIMAKEIEEVEALVASFIAFARDDPAEETRVRLDLTALLQSIADDQAEAGRDVTLDAGERVVITGQSLGLKRLFTNLIDNALKYGASARMSLRREDGAVIVDVADAGPGIPADQRESVFEPFVRLNTEGTRGAGLGLAAARSIARAHGGDVTIAETETGALLRVTLPG